MKECQQYMIENNEQSSKDIFYHLKGGKYDKQNTKGLLAFRDENMYRIVLDAISN